MEPQEIELFEKLKVLTTKWENLSTEVRNSPKYTKRLRTIENLQSTITDLKADLAADELELLDEILVDIFNGELSLTEIKTPIPKSFKYYYRLVKSFFKPLL